MKAERVRADLKYILYHADCPDGFGAAFAAWMALDDSGAEVTYIPCRYGDDPPELPPGADVVLVDFSFKRPVLEALSARVNSLLVLDHHKSAQADLTGLPYAHFDMRKSGAVLSWEHFMPHAAVPTLLLYIQDRDLWRFELVDSREINAAIHSYPQDFKVWLEMLLGHIDLLSEGRTLRRKAAKTIKSNLELAFLSEIADYVVPVVNTNHEISETCNELCKLYPQYAFAAAYFDHPSGKRKWSLRSVGDFDVSEVAKRHGGGGHRNAAGFELVEGLSVTNKGLPQ